MSKRTRTATVDDMTHRFDLGDAGDFRDGPTVLPGPWSPPPDPGFRTGTVLRIDRVDLRNGNAPGVEPFDSAQATVRFSREEVLELIGEPTAAARPARRTAARPARPAARPANPTARPAKPAALGSETAALPPRELPPADRTAPASAGSLFRLYGWLALQLALAFVAGVLTGVIAVR